MSNRSTAKHQSPCSQVPYSTAAWAALACTASLAFACERQPAAQERAEEAQDRKEIVQDIQAEAPESAAEMRDQVGLHQDGEEYPKTEQEIRDDMGLHPDEKETE